MKRQIPLILLTCLVVLFLAGCNKTTETNVEPTTEEPVEKIEAARKTKKQLPKKNMTHG